MSWRFPRAREMDGYPMDVDAINENFEAFIEEIQGRTNEHNWVSGAFTSHEEDCRTGYVVKAWNVWMWVDPGFGQGNLPPLTTPATGFKVSPNMDWVVIDDLTITAMYDTAKVWIIASFQQEPSDPVESFRAGMNYGIRIDGILVWDSVIGGADRSNDPRGEGLGADWDSGPIVIDVVLPITSGRHTIDVVARLPRDEKFNIPGTDDYYMILNRELIVLETF